MHQNHKHSQKIATGTSWSESQLAFTQNGQERGGCSSVGRAGGPVIRMSLVQFLASWGGTELRVEVSLSKILNPSSWHLVWQPLPSVRGLRWAGPLSETGFDPSKPQGKKVATSRDPHGLSGKKTERFYCIQILPLHSCLENYQGNLLWRQKHYITVKLEILTWSLVAYFWRQVQEASQGTANVT